MRGFQNGRQFDIDDRESWSSLFPERGTVMEVSMQHTSIGSAGEEWAAFFITGVTACLDGSIDVTAQYLGCEDPSTGGILSSSFGQGGGKIHLCTVKPCIEFPNEVRGPEVLHVTLLRLWEAESFSADYLIDGAETLIKKWQSALAKDKPGKRPAARRAPGKGAAAKSAGKTPRARKGEDKEEPAEKKEKKKEKTLGEITQAQKEKLKARLKDIRKKHHTVGDSAEEDTELLRSGSEGCGEDFAEDESSGYAPTEPLDTGALMKDPPTGRRSKGHTGREDRIVPYKDTRGNTMRTLSDQLAQRALAISRARGDADKKRRRKRSGGSVIGALQKALGRATDKKKKKDKGSKKRKKRRRKLENGVIVSSSASSGESSDPEELEEEESSSSELEAPMKKRSREKPGSVLALLIEHIRNQMEQDALVDLPEEKKVTGGVKVVSYFHQHIKNAYSSHQKELREMYTLGSAIDLLRRGDVAKVGDALSARFIAIHQSLLDQGWAAARHMELFPLEDASAATSSMVLATRRHTKLVEKVQGKGQSPPWSWQGKGRARGKGDWSYSGEGGNKGKKGKGDQRGKGKGKGWQNQDKGSNEWAKTQDKADGTK